MLFVHSTTIYDGGNIVAVVVFLIMKGQLCGILYDPQLINNPNVGNRFFLVGSTWSAFGTSLDKSAEWSKIILKSIIFLVV